MNPVLLNDLITLGIIFGALVFICLVLLALRKEGSVCNVCGGDEYFDVVDGNGLISNRMVMRCHDCKSIRDVTPEDLRRDVA